MKKKIIISEDMEVKLYKRLLDEDNNNNNAYYPDPDKVVLLKKFLDDNFTKGEAPDVDGMGMPSKTVLITMKGNGTTVMRPEELFYFMQERFKTIEKDVNDRDKLLKQVINDWIGDKITPEGGLSLNFF